MRLQFAVATLCLLALPALAQTTPTLYAAPGDVAAAEAKGKAAATMTPQMLVAVPPYRAVVEFRAKPTPASVHEKEDEFVEVIGGSGTMLIGGTLKEQTRRNATNLAGSGIDGGKSYDLAKGSYLFIPAGTAHYFASMGADGLTIVSLHVPHAAQ
jgi:mannose-6-phosphate isomerase-like protein (cupin superfamily)